MKDDRILAAALVIYRAGHEHGWNGFNVAFDKLDPYAGPRFSRLWNKHCALRMPQVPISPNSNTNSHYPILTPFNVPRLMRTPRLRLKILGIWE